MTNTIETAVQNIVAGLVAILAAVSSQATVTFKPPPGFYYFNSATGSDANDCMSPATACRTIGKANSLIYVPGDKILLAGTFVGNVTMTPQTVPSLGNASKPITIASVDPNNRATITSGPTADTGIVLASGVSGITVDGLILRGGDLANMPRGGVKIENLTAAPISGFVVRNSDVANIAYFAATKPPGPIGQGGFGGHIFVQGYPGTGGIADVLIENNDLHGLNGPTSHDDVGVSGWGGQPISNVTIRGNRVWDIGGGPTGLNPGAAYPPLGDGIQGVGWSNILIERNVVHDVGANMKNCGGPAGILTAGVSGGLIQFNEVYRVQPVNYVQGCDWLGIDLDNGTVGVTVQYNYTHDNFGSGLYLFDGDGSVAWNNNTLRYNISQNDSTGGFTGFGAIGISTPRSPNLYVYGNTVFNNLTYHGQWYQNAGQGAVGISISNTGSFGGLIANNLIMVGPSIYGGCLVWNARQYQAGWAPPVEVKNNHFQCTNGGTYFDTWWGQTEYFDVASMAAASGKFQNTTHGDPMIVAGGSGPNGYRLRVGSPMIGTGVNLTGIVPKTSRDYFGATVPHAGGWNKGADGAEPPQK
jgi:hypothetical protein